MFTVLKGEGRAEIWNMSRGDCPGEGGRFEKLDEAVEMATLLCLQNGWKSMQLFDCQSEDDMPTIIVSSSTFRRLTNREILDLRSAKGG
jgi:hypothetical protein